MRLSAIFYTSNGNIEYFRYKFFHFGINPSCCFFLSSCSDCNILIGGFSRAHLSDWFINCPVSTIGARAGVGAVDPQILGNSYFLGRKRKIWAKPVFKEGPRFVFEEMDIF